MLAKLLALLSTAKGAAAATAIAAAAAGTVIVATDQDVQNAVKNSIRNVAQSTDDKDSGKPAVVAARNKADDMLRDAFHTDQRKLEKLHSTHVDSADRAKLADTLKTADAALRAELTKALDKVATWTLGREGRESPRPTGSPDMRQPFTAQSELERWVTDEIKAMDAIVAKADQAVTALAAADRGMPADAGKPSDAGKPANPAKPSDSGKPADSGKPGNLPTPPTRP